jgi:hypothetical protein
MKFNIFIDDFRNPKDAFLYTRNPLYNILKWDIVKNYDEFINFIINNGLSNIEFISFDHDISDEHYDDTISQENYTEKTGYDCAKWLVNYCMDNNFKLPNYFVHSMNPAGKQNILSILNNYKKHCE